MNKFCKNCGSQLNTDTGFCPNCGSPIGENNNQQSIPNNIQNQTNTTVKDNTVTGFVLSLLGFLCCTYLAIPGLIISILSLQKINKGELISKNKGLAIAGIILGAIGILLLIKNLVAPDPDVTNLVNELINA